MGVMLQFLVLLSLYSIVISLYVCCVTAYCMSKRLVNSMLVSLSNREIFALSADYAPNNRQTNVFFSTIQNKLHYAIHGHTAAELIMLRADSSQPNMGLTS